MRLTILLLYVLCAGCENPPTTVINQCERNAIFERCMKLLPAGPVAAKYNDWSEVVGNCDDIARYQSYHAPEFVPPACRSER